MKILIMLALGLFLIVGCQEEHVCNCIVYNEQGQATKYSKITYHVKNRNAEKICLERAKGFLSNSESYMVCELEELPSLAICKSPKVIG